MPTQSRRDEKQAAALQAIAKGHTITAAARIAGVDRQTIYNWMQDSTFSTAVRDAEDSAAALHEAVVLESDDWRARMAVLERRRRADWAKAEVVDHSGEVTVKVVRE